MACGNNHVTRGGLSSGPVPVATQVDQQLTFFRHLVAPSQPSPQENFHEECLDRYKEQATGPTEVVAVDVESATYQFDIAAGRLVSMTATSAPTDAQRDSSRQAGFPLERPADSDKKYHRGHALSHKAGGGLDINVFPQLGSVNVGNGWREFERYSVEHPGTPMAIAFVYADDTAVPSELEFTITRVDGTSETRRFSNQ